MERLFLMISSPTGDETLARLQSRYSGLVASTEAKEGVSLEGFVLVKEKHYHIKLRLPHFPELKDFELIVRQQICSKRFTEQSAGFSNSWSVEDLLQNLPLLIDSASKNAKESPAPQETAVDSQDKLNANNPFPEIASLQNSDLYVTYPNESHTSICFTGFAVNKQHYLEVDLPSLYILKHSLPHCIKVDELLSKCETLTEIVQQYQELLQKLKPFYESFNGIDKHCYVVQPAKPTTKHQHRVFLLREHVFLKLVISDPFAPLESKILQIIGPTAENESLRNTCIECLKNWDNEKDMHSNLLRIFDLVYFPKPPSNASDAEEQRVCNICYSSRLEDNDGDDCDIPIVSCDNPKCSAVFHDACLMEWFSNVLIFEVNLGKCTFCKANLSVSYLELFAK